MAVVKGLIGGGGGSGVGSLQKPAWDDIAIAESENANIVL